MTLSKPVRAVLVASIFVVLALGVALAFEVHVMRIYGTRQNAVHLRVAANHWRQTHDGCPSPEMVRDAGGAEPSPAIVDMWGSRFTFRCTNEDTAVISAGPDRREGTDDDISVPDLGR